MLTPIKTTPLGQVETGEAKDLKKACKDLEGVFVNMMFSSMRKTMSMAQEKKGHEAFAKETVNSMLDEQWAKMSSEGEGLGIWKLLYDDMKPR